MPLCFDEVSGEPYLKLPIPHESIKITLPRLIDTKAVAAMMNDPRVYPYLIGPPFPYTEKHAEDFLHTTKKQSDSILLSIPNLAERPSTFLASGCPMKSIRQSQEDGTEIYIGDITLDRGGYVELGLEDSEELERFEKENEAKTAGDPTINWTLGDCLAPSHHGQGIMTSALHELITEWAIPHLNIHRLVATAFADNIGSHRVFLKNGFKHIRTIRRTHASGEMFTKGRGDCTQHVFEWIRPSVSP